MCSLARFIGTARSSKTVRNSELEIAEGTPYQPVQPPDEPPEVRPRPAIVHHAIGVETADDDQTAWSSTHIFHSSRELPWANYSGLPQQHPNLTHRFTWIVRKCVEPYLRSCEAGSWT